MITKPVFNPFTGNLDYVTVPRAKWDMTDDVYNFSSSNLNLNSPLVPKVLLYVWDGNTAVQNSTLNLPPASQNAKRMIRIHHNGQKFTDGSGTHKTYITILTNGGDLIKLGSSFLGDTTNTLQIGIDHTIEMYSDGTTTWQAQFLYYPDSISTS